MPFASASVSAFDPVEFVRSPMHLHAFERNFASFLLLLNSPHLVEELKNHGIKMTFLLRSPAHTVLNTAQLFQNWNVLA